MPGPSVTFQPIQTIALASEEEGNALSDDDLRALICMVDAAGAAVRRSDGQYELVRRKLDLFSEGQQRMIIAAAGRANANAVAPIRSAVQPASDDDSGDKLPEVFKAIPKGLQLLPLFQKVLAGASHEGPFWWGVRVNLTQGAADALKQVLREDLPLLNLLIPFVPHAAVVVPVLTAAGAAIGKWVSDVNCEKGVKVELLF